MDFRRLRAVQDGGRPLHVRHVRAAIREADMVADGVQMVKSSDIEKLLDEKAAEAVYRVLPGGEELAREVRNRVDVDSIERNLSERQFHMHGRSALTGEYSLFAARKLVSLAMNDAWKDIFLSGYGIETAQGLEHGKIQELVDNHPAFLALQAKYGLTFDARQASDYLYKNLSEKLSNKLYQMGRHPGSVPGDGTVRKRMEEALAETANRVIGEFFEGRAEALAHLYGMQERGEIRPEDMASKGADESEGLASVVLDRRIPPGVLTKLYGLRGKVPDNLGDLVDVNCTMEQKVRVLAQLGDVIEELFDGLSEEDRRNYSPGQDSKLTFVHDCGRFLLHGKVSSQTESAIRDAVATDSPGSDLLELYQGIAGMRGGMYDAEAIRAHWEHANVPLDSMAMTGVAMLGPDSPPLIGRYSTGAVRVLNAMRDCGFKIPPPGDPRVENSGKGSFSEQARAMAETEMLEDLSRENQRESTKYPGFLAEAVEDYSRANYSVGGASVERGNADAVVESIRDFCTDDENNLDPKLCNIVGQLVYQRSDSMALLRLAFGNGGSGDTERLWKSAPFLGMAVFASTGSHYDISRNPQGNVVVHISASGSAKQLDYYRNGQQLLDPERSRIAFDVYVEVDPVSYSARVSDMTYDYHFVPTESPS